MLLEESKLALLGSVSHLTQTLDCLEAGGVLATRHNLALVLHQVLLGETTGSVLGRTMPDLGLGAHRNLRTAHHAVHVVSTHRVVTTILAGHVATTASHA